MTQIRPACDLEVCGVADSKSETGGFNGDDASRKRHRQFLTVLFGFGIVLCNNPSHFSRVFMLFVIGGGYGSNVW